MINIPDYEINEQIYRGKRVAVYRGLRTRDNKAVIIKVYIKKFLSNEDVNLFRHEFEIGGLFNHNNITKYYGIEYPHNRPAIISEDIRAAGLRDTIPANGIEIKKFLNIAVQLAEGLSAIHDAKIIHKNINPNNIVISRDGATVKLIDFAISTKHGRAGQHNTSPDKLDGTLEYIAPEQTGRMNRSTDYRADFYSLGASFYELLSGRVPHQANNDLEYIHCHIAKEPDELTEIRADIPKMISNIVMKLLQKNAEDRYQNAKGLKSDLQRCLDDYENNGKIGLFELGLCDFSDKFQISQKLYGREKDIERLIATFERACNGKSEMLMISGYSGVGKSTLVHEIIKSVTSKRGYFITGKFNQFSKDAAYGAIAAAFQELVRQILGESEESIKEWKASILAALGANTQIIIDVAPKVELIVGKQPPAPKLGPVESENRFKMVFYNFVSVFARKEHPLALFLDDLQWADSAGLKLINLLATEQELCYFLLIGSYRDNEVDSSHPAIMTLEEIEKTRGKTQTIVLEPLDISNTNHLVAGALNCSLDKSQPLTNEIFNKTGGNPFFIKLFLQSLHDEEMLMFMPGKGWQWDMDKIHQMRATDNVIEFMLRKLNNLPASTLQTLKPAACLGNSFEISALAIISGQSSENALLNLQPCLNMGILIQSNDTCRFVHDRAQEASYSLIPPDQRQKTRLEIGYQLLKNTEEENLTEHIFQIVDHLNIGAGLINDDGKQIELARLNLLAGKKAKKNAAYKVGLIYFRTGMDLLAGDFWDEHYTLSFDLHIECAEVEYLSGNFEQSRKLINATLRHAKTNIEKTGIYSMLIYQYTVAAEYGKGINAGREALGLLGIYLPKTGLRRIFNDEIKSAGDNLNGREIASLIDAPEMTNPEHKAAMNVLMNLQPTTYMADPELYNVIAVKMANISLKYGHSIESGKAYVTYANVLSSVLGEYQLGYKYCLLGLRMSEKENDLVQKCRGSFIYIAFLLHWTKHYKFAETAFFDGYKTGLECGDLQYAGYILGFGSANIFYQGEPLGSLRKKLATYMKFVKKAKLQMPIDAIQSFQLAVSNLTGKTRGKFSFDLEEISENKFLEDCRSRNVIGIGYFQILKAQILYMYGKPLQALQCVREAENVIDFIQGTGAVAEYNFYYSLILADLYNSASKETQIEYWNQLETNLKQMKIWADNCKANFHHKYLLIGAEMARITNNPLEATRLYDEAIESAEKNKFIQNCALANELAAKLWLTRGKEDFAANYLENAYYGYRLWEATAKTEEMEEKYPQLNNASATYPQRFNKGFAKKEPSIGARFPAELDMTSLLKALQTISSEIVLKTLLEKVMATLIENAGAHRAFLALERDGKLYIEAESNIDGAINTGYSVAVDECNNISRAIVNYVKRTKEDLALEDAFNDGMFAQDEYILKNRPKSILCMPILNQAKLVGVMYLENNLATHVFTHARLGIVRMLSAQAAISLENALLYHKMKELNAQLEDYSINLEQKVDERTIELKEKSENLALKNADLFKANRTIHEQVRQLENLHKEKDHLLAIVAHDLRNPIAIIVTCYKFLYKDYGAVLGDDGGELVGMIKQTCERMFKLIDDLLDSAKLDMEGYKLDVKAENLTEFLNVILHGFKKDAEAKDIELIAILPQKEINVNIDTKRFWQICNNLLSNAIKFIEGGGKITISLEEVMNSRSQKAILKVNDTGIGIPKDQIPIIFNKFTTASREGTRGETSTGLGMSITKRIVELHQGRIWVESEVDKGSTFFIELPLCKG